LARIDLDTRTLPEFERRVAAVASTEQRRWGTMPLARMLAHLRIVFEISLEERETKDESRAWLLDLMRRFVERSETDPERVVLEPMLGHISLKRWRRVHGIHTDYHLRQFGA